MNKTKVSIVMLVVALCSAFGAQAKFSIGPKLGLNVDKMHINEKILDSDNRCGFTGGVTAEYIAPVLGLGADISVMYTHMSSKIAIEPSVGGNSVTLHTTKVSGNFIEIPLHLKYKLSLPAIQSIIAPYIFTGPNAAIKIGGENSYTKTHGVSWGWDLGIGVELIRHLQIGAGYTWGMNNVAKHFDIGGTTINSDIKIKNNYWTVTAAWLF